MLIFSIGIGKLLQMELTLELNFFGLKLMLYLHFSYSCKVSVYLGVVE